MMPTTFSKTVLTVTCSGCLIRVTPSAAMAHVQGTRQYHGICLLQLMVSDCSGQVTAWLQACRSVRGDH